MQIHASQSDESLQELFQDEQYATLLNDTGFRRPLSLLKLEDKEELANVLDQYYSFIRGD